MMNIPYARQEINEEDIQAVGEILKSDWLTQGPTIEKFEQAVANYCGVKYAVAVNSATSALHIACLAAGLGQDDALWTSPNTFVASANCGLYCGATVDFVDINSRTYNLDPACLEAKLLTAAQTGKLPKVVIPVHFAGQSCAMAKIWTLANEYGFTVIEDASHAIGGTYRNTPVGSCQYSDMAVFSFHPVKIITTAEGGIVVTNRKDLYDKLILYRSHGITRKPELMTEEPHGPWYYQMLELGFNYRMSDLQAALGVSQMARLDEFITKRHLVAERYRQELKDLPLILPWQQQDTYSAYHLYVIRLPEKTAHTHKQVFVDLRARGIGVNIHYIPVHLQPYYQNLGFKKGDFPNAESYYKTAISIPMYAALTVDDQSYVISSLKEVLK